jgi:hypothetical protein
MLDREILPVFSILLFKLQQHRNLMLRVMSRRWGFSRFWRD